MVECFDRIHLQLTEVVLKPLRALQAQPARATARVRLPGRGCRIVLTVTKHPPPNGDHTCVYTWFARGGDPADTQSWGSDDRFDSPEAAYWQAVDVIGASLRRRTSV